MDAPLQSAQQDLLSNLNHHTIEVLESIVGENFGVDDSGNPRESAWEKDYRPLRRLLDSLKRISDHALPRAVDSDR